MARVLLALQLCLLLSGATLSRAETPVEKAADHDFRKLDLSGEWYVLIHYKDERSEDKSVIKFKDFAWSIHQTPRRLVWERYPYVLFDEELELVRRHAMNEHLPWEPDERIWKGIREAIEVSSRAMSKKRLEGSVEEGFSSRPPRAGGMGTLTFSRNWEVTFAASSVRIEIVDSLSGSHGLAGLEERPTFEILEPLAPGELRGRWSEGSRRGSFRMLRARKRRVVK